MSQIRIGFSRPNNWFEPFSWLIRLVTWCPFSHAYMVYFDDYSKKEIVFQASGLKVNFIGYDLFKTEENILAEFQLNVSEQTKFNLVQFAITNIGLSYGVLQIVGFVWIYFMKIFGKNVSNPFYSTNTDFCSEIVTRILQEIPNINDTENPGVSTPKDVYNFLISKGYKSINV